jgi:hypothetical protein
LTTDAPLVGAFRTDIPRELATLIARLICRKPDKRPAAPAEVVVAFEPFSVVSRLKSALPVNVSGKDPNLLDGVDTGKRSSASPADPERQKQRIGSRQNSASWLAQLCFYLSPDRLLSKWTTRNGHGALRKKTKSRNALAGRNDRETGA